MTVTAATGYQRILVAMDFSPHADAAFRVAVWLARSNGASITLAHCYPDLRSAVHKASTRAKLDLLYGEGNEFQREVRQKSDARMKQMISQLGATDLTIQYETLLGDPDVELTHAVQSEGYDLVLAGTRGRSAWESFFVGSTARRLIRICPASVWIVRAEQQSAPKVVLAATDFSDVSHKAVAHGLWVARQANAQFHVLTVIDSMDIPEEVISNVPEGGTLHNEINEESRARLNSLLESLSADRNAVQVHLAWGTPWKEIKRLAQQLQAELVAIGTVGRSGIEGIVLGNTAEQILGACDCSILTVKPDDFVSPIVPPSWPLHPEP